MRTYAHAYMRTNPRVWSPRWPWTSRRGTCVWTQSLLQPPSVCCKILFLWPPPLLTRPCFPRGPRWQPFSCPVLMERGNLGVVLLPISPVPTWPSRCCQSDFLETTSDWRKCTLSPFRASPLFTKWLEWHSPNWHIRSYATELQFIIL